MTSDPGENKGTRPGSMEPIPRIGLLSLFFGVVLPAFALIFEIISRACASIAFDPIPTIWHILFIALVPVANAALFISIRCRDTRHFRILMQLNGIAIGISLYYSLMFSAMTPFAVMALIACGLGLIPLSPLLSFIVALLLRRKLKQLAPDSCPPKPWYYLSAGFAAMILLGVPAILTFAGAKLASKEESRSTGMHLLRQYGNEECLLRHCYRTDRPLSVSGLLSMLNIKPGFLEIRPEQARQIYYRLTGNLYDSVRPPDLRGVQGSRSIGPAVNDGEFDWNQGGDSVAAPVKGLSLKESGVDSMVDSDSATSYTEWTLVFQNNSQVQREARAQVALPPGGVVSRLTLWINGEEREAAYNERGKVKDAYKSVVQQRRDPVLATTSGKDCIMLQCFPVPPTGGVMKIRIGITAPLTLESQEQALLRLPFFIEKNFSVSDTNRQTVRVQSNSPITLLLPCESLVTAPSNMQVNGSIQGLFISSPFTLKLSRPAGILNTWTERKAAGRDEIIRQSIVEKPLKSPEQVIIVIDGSGRMAKHMEAISRAIAGLPDHIRFSILLAGDDVVEVSSLRKRNAEERRIAAGNIMEAGVKGGCDNAPALEAAFETLKEHPESAIIWIHSIQPVELSYNSGLARSIRNRTDGPALYSLQLDTGINVLRKTLEGMPETEFIPDFGDAGHSLERIFASLSGTAKVFHFEREAGIGPTSGTHVWPHVARLWAHERILRLEKSASDEDLKKAVALAMLYQLVTPVSGAVVLETEEQYKRAGLNPVDPLSVPGVAVVPEPETWALIATGIFIIFLASRRKTECA